MKLDPRIILQTDILTCFDTERAGKFIGQKGYFSNDLRCFENLRSCKYGTLTAILCDKTEEGYAYLQDNNNRYQDFFLPESSLKPEEKKPEEKKLRPYTLEEFEDLFPIGEPIRYRERDAGGLERHLILNGYWNDKSGGEITTYVYIGPFSYTLDDLFAAYEWEDPFNGDWRPFAWEVEE